MPRPATTASITADLRALGVAPGDVVIMHSASRWMGRLTELVRTWPGAVRSEHPQVSFAAAGEHAAEVVAGHPSRCGAGGRTHRCIAKIPPYGVASMSHVLGIRCHRV